MSWLSRSIVNSFKPDNHDDVEENDDDKQYSVYNNTFVSTNQKHEQHVSGDNWRRSPGIGVKQDLSEITKTFIGPFRGVASLIAFNERSESSEKEAIAGIRRDFAEIGGRFRSGILKVSNNIDVSGITKLATDFLQMESEDDDEDSSDGDGDDEESEDDDELLSTPKIVKARVLLALESNAGSYSEITSDFKSKEASAIETVKHPLKSDDIQVVDKSVIQEESHEGKHEDDWLKGATSEIVSNRVAISIEGNDVVSLSDLNDDDDDYDHGDDDDDGDIPIHYKIATYTIDSSTIVKKLGSIDSLRQVSFHNSETKESNDWLDVVGIDVA